CIDRLNPPSTRLTPMGVSLLPGVCAQVSPAPEPAWTTPTSRASLRRSKKNVSI
ncbi:MAG: hypothetical protein AVDCRST_MAG86-4364, partial [uncultured Truepera sp.]